MEIQLRSVEHDLICVSCRGMIRQTLDSDLRGPLRMINDQSWAGTMLLNLREAEYIDSSGIAWLIDWYRQITKVGGVLALCEVPPRIADVLRICQLDRVLTIWKDEAAARAALRASPPSSPDTLTPPRESKSR